MHVCGPGFTSLLSDISRLVFFVSWFSAHQSRVTMILFVLELEWVLSTGQDKQFAWHCSESGQRLGGYHTSAVASGLQYPLLDKTLWWVGT